MVCRITSSVLQRDWVFYVCGNAAHTGCAKKMEGRCMEDGCGKRVGGGDDLRHVSSDIKNRICPRETRFQHEQRFMNFNCPGWSSERASL